MHNWVMDAGYSVANSCLPPIVVIPSRQGIHSVRMPCSNQARISRFCRLPGFRHSSSQSLFALCCFAASSPGFEYLFRSLSLCRLVLN